MGLSGSPLNRSPLLVRTVDPLPKVQYKKHYVIADTNEQYKL